MNGLHVAQHVKQVLSEKVEHVKTEILVKLGAPGKQMIPKLVMKEIAQVKQSRLTYSQPIKQVTLQIKSINS